MKLRYMLLAAGAAAILSTNAEKIVIMHTNDTHSAIDPDGNGLGGVARRGALIDSIRQANPVTYLLDAGDAVQGTTYFNLYKGEIEAKALNALGYDYITLGNHEFDNGMEGLARYYDGIDATKISTNYDVRDTPLDGRIDRYAIITTPDSTRIGLLAINVDPAGMISPDKCAGIKYQDPVKAANATAWHLKNNEGCDYVIALTHIGYEYGEAFDDIDLATASSDIDIVIGGHSHTLVKPGTTVANADGRPVNVVQTGNGGRYLGVLTIDTDNGTVTDRNIPVDGRLDSRLDPAIVAMIEPYRQGVDSLRSIVIGKTRIDTDDRKSEELVNFVAGVTASRAAKLVEGNRVDIAIANRGGIRTPMHRGNVTKGQILEMLPFDNHVVVLEMTGSDLIESFLINSNTGRVGYDRAVTLTLDGGGNPIAATIAGQAVDPTATYRVATIDYIANGGDYMKPMTRGKVTASSPNLLNEDVMDHIAHLKNRTIPSDGTPHFKLVISD